MTDLQALIDDIRGAPDDDAPRLVWADAVGGERGEFVVIQCDLERGKLAPRDAVALRRRQKELLARYGTEWSGLAGFAKRVSFRRGFVDAAEIQTMTFVEHAPRILFAAPLLSSLTATGLETHGMLDRVHAIEMLTTLFAHPAYDALRGLDIIGAGNSYEAEDSPLAYEYLGDHAIELLVQSGALRHLRALGIDHSGVGSAGVRAMLGSRALHAIERLALREFLRDDALTAIFETGGLGSLRALDLGTRQDLQLVAPRIPTTVTDLRIGEIGSDPLQALAMGRVTDEELRALAGSPVAPRLERLAITNLQIERAADLFGQFPNLRALSLRGIFGINRPGEFERAIVRLFSSVKLHALRELVLHVKLGEDSTRMLVETFGPQLELLDMRGNNHALRFVNELKQHVAGELLVGDAETRGLLRVGSATQMPWWDHVIV